MHRMLSLVALCAAAAAIPADAQNVTLLSSKKRTLGNPTTTAYAGVWGYTDPVTYREYALVGERTSTWIVDCTNPSAPVEVAAFAAPSSTWREITGYKQYVYSVSENHSGIRVLDLTNPAVPVDAGYVLQANFSRTHSISVDPGTGRVYANGTPVGMVVLDAAANPLSPSVLGTRATPYVHDSYWRRGKGYLAEINNGRLTIVNSANPASLTTISSTVTPGAFTHNAWVTEDDRLMLTTDENSAGYLKAYDITNPAAPAPLASYLVSTAIVHNVFGIGRVAYVAHYTDGLHVLDVSRAATQIDLLGRYDTSANATRSYNGAWGAYPWTDSGVVYASDMQNGLFCLQVDVGHLNRYGLPTAGAGGAVPRASFDGAPPRVNANACRLEMTGLPANGSWLMIFSGGQGNLQVAGITVHVDLSNVVLINGTADANGKAALPLPIPNQAGLANQKLYAQIVAVGAGGQISASRGMWFGIAP